MGNQAAVQSIEALKAFRNALALFADDTLAALGGVDMEARRMVQWVQHDRAAYWQDQVKRRRELVAMAQSEVFRRKLAKTADYTPAYSEQKERLRQAEASLRDAEHRAVLVKKWEPALQQAILEYRSSVGRIRNLAGGDVPRAIALLERIIDALEAYLREAPPSGVVSPSPFGSIMETVLATLDVPDTEPDPDQPEPPTDEPVPGQDENGHGTPFNERIL